MNTDHRAECCGSSVVEHTLGKGEVESSILSHSTINAMQLIDIFVLYNSHTRSDPQSVPHLRLNGFGWMSHIGLHLSEKKIAFASALGGGDLQVMSPISRKCRHPLISVSYAITP